MNTEVKKITLGSILGWGVGALLVILGITQLFSKPLIGILVLLLSAVILPPANRLVADKFKFTISNRLKFVLTVVLIGLIILCMPSKPSPSPSPTADVNTPPATTQIEYKIIKRWDIPNGGETKQILIPSTYLNEADMNALGEKLKQDTAQDRNAFIQVYTDERAAELRSKVLSETATEAEGNLYGEHFVGLYVRNINTGFDQFNIFFDGVRGSNSKTITY